MTDFDIGKVCKIQYVPPKYRTHKGLLYEIGTIVEIHGSKQVGISVPGYTNICSNKNLFWFTDDEITIIEEEKPTMKIKFDKDAKFATLINPAKPDDSTIGVYYGELKEDDVVVCNYGYGNNALSVRVVRTSYITPEMICPDAVECEIMGVCDISDYLERQHKRERCAELKKQMTERAKKYQEEEFWRHIAGSDPAMAELFKEFEELTK